MHQNLLILSVLFFQLTGCSTFVYTPIVATSALGLNKTDLNDKPEFKNLTNRPFSLKSGNGSPWQLKKFNGGRYHIERASTSTKKEVICNLLSGKTVIKQIFDDSISGGIFYNATVRCGGESYNAPLNHWSNSIKSSIVFDDGKK